MTFDPKAVASQLLTQPPDEYHGIDVYEFSKINPKYCKIDGIFQNYGILERKFGFVEYLKTFIPDSKSNDYYTISQEIKDEMEKEIKNMLKLKESSSVMFIVLSLNPNETEINKAINSTEHLNFLKNLSSGIYCIQITNVHIDNIAYFAKNNIDIKIKNLNILESLIELKILKHCLAHHIRQSNEVRELRVFMRNHLFRGKIPPIDKIVGHIDDIFKLYIQNKFQIDKIMSENTKRIGLYKSKFENIFNKIKK